MDPTLGDKWAADVEVLGESPSTSTGNLEQPFWTRKRKWMAAITAGVAAAIAVAVPTAVVLSRGTSEPMVEPTSSTSSTLPGTITTPASGPTVIPLNMDIPSKTLSGYRGTATTLYGENEDGTPYPTFFLASATVTANPWASATPTWAASYEGAQKRGGPDCDILQASADSQPSFARFPQPFPEQPVLSQQILVDVNAAPYFMDVRSPDNFASVSRAIEDCRAAVKAEEGCYFSMKKGVYRFATDRPLTFFSLSNMTLDGSGSMWLFSREKLFSHLVIFDACSSVLVKDLQIDWDYDRWRLASLIRIEGIQALSAESSNSGNGDQQIRLKFVDSPTLDPATIHLIADLHKVDPETGVVGVAGDRTVASFWRLQDLILRTEKDAGSEDILTITLRRGLWPAPTLGALYLARHFTYDGHAIVLINTRDIWLDRVSVWGAPGMALAARPGSANVRVTSFILGILDGVGVRRRMSSAADGLNFIGVSGHIHVSNSDLGFGGDDCSNAHPTIIVGIERTLEANRVVLKDWQRSRMGPMERGDVLEFRNADFSPTSITRSITSDPVWVPGSGWSVTLDNPLPRSGEVSLYSSDDRIIVFNLRHTSDSILYRRLKCHSNRSRGILLQQPVGGVEYSCFLGIEKRALSITADVRPGSWAEGMGINDLYIRGNRFERTDKVDDGYGVIWTGVQGADWSMSNFDLLKNVTIEGNEFVGFPRRSVVVGSAAEVRISRNAFINTEGAQSDERGQILVERANNVRVEENEWRSRAWTASELVRVYTRNSRDITVEGNKVSD